MLFPLHTLEQALDLAGLASVDDLMNEINLDTFPLLDLDELEPLVQASQTADVEGGFIVPSPTQDRSK